jgi:hypothetical protein
VGFIGCSCDECVAYCNQITVATQSVEIFFFVEHLRKAGVAQRLPRHVTLVEHEDPLAG